MPTALAHDASNEEIIALIDQWVSLLEQEKYGDALAFIDAEPFWTAELFREILTDYGYDTDARITLFNNGMALDGDGNLEIMKQRKDVEWYDEGEDEGARTFDEGEGDIWYDLNINNLVSDLTATFNLERRDRRLYITLQDIHMM